MRHRHEAVIKLNIMRAANFSEGSKRVSILTVNAENPREPKIPGGIEFYRPGRLGRPMASVKMETRLLPSEKFAAHMILSFITASWWWRTCLAFHFLIGKPGRPLQGFLPKAWFAGHCARYGTKPVAAKTFARSFAVIAVGP